MKQLFTILTAVVLMILGCSCSKEHIKYDQLKGNSYDVFLTEPTEDSRPYYTIHFKLDNTYTAGDWRHQVFYITGFYLDGTNDDYIYLPCGVGGYWHPEKAILKDTTISFRSKPKVKVLKATFVDSGIEYYLKKDESLPTHYGRW